MSQTPDSIESRNASQNTGSSESKKKSRGRVENLIPWKPGQSGNPGGRPKKDWASEIAQAVFSENADAVYRAMGKALLKGNAYAFKELAERAFGKLVERKEITGKEGGPLEVAGLTDDEVTERLAAIERQLGIETKVDSPGRTVNSEARTAEQSRAQ